MAFTAPPKIGEYLICTKDECPVYYDPRSSAERVQSNYQSDQSFHAFRKGDQIGKLVDDGVIRDTDGNNFYKVEVWQWKTKGLELFHSFETYQEFFTAYVRVEHEPEWWIRESQKDNYQQAQQKVGDEAEVTAYISGLRGVPQPTSINKETDGTIRLTFANGYQTTFKEFKNLASDTVRTLTTEDKTKKVDTTVTTQKLTNNGTGGSGSGSGSVLTPTVLLIGLGSLLMMGLFIVLTLRKK